MHRSLFRAVLAAGMALFTTACANPGPVVSEKDDMPASSGFASKKANTAARLPMLKSLPPHQFVARTINGRPTYLYSDPTICACIYVGDQGAYDRYRQQITASQTAADTQIRAVLSSAPLAGESGL